MEKTGVTQIRGSDESPIEQVHDGYRHGSVTNKLEVGEEIHHYSQPLTLFLV